MDDGVQPFQPLPVHCPRRRIPSHLVAGALPPAHPPHAVTSGAQEMHEGVSDEPRTSGDRHLQHPPGGVAPVELQVVRQTPLPEVQHALQRPPHHTGGENLAHTPEGWLPFHHVLHPAAVVVQRLETVLVAPSLERPLPLLVHEEAILLEVGVLDLPTEAGRTPLEVHHDPASSLQASLPAQNPDLFPGRGEPLERSRTGMPREHLVYGMIQLHAVAIGGHALAPVGGAGQRASEVE